LVIQIFYISLMKVLYMRRNNLVIDIIGFGLVSIVSPTLFINGFIGLGIMSVIVGVFLIDYNR